MQILGIRNLVIGAQIKLRKQLNEEDKNEFKRR
jgi:hypothetical protein